MSTQTPAATSTPTEVPPDVLNREVIFFAEDTANPQTTCGVFALRPSTKQVVRLTESLTPSEASGGTGTRYAPKPLPPKYLFVTAAEPSEDGGKILLEGQGASDGIALQNWGVLDRATGLVSGIEPDPTAPFETGFHTLPDGAKAQTLLHAAAWAPSNDGTIVGLLMTGRDDKVDVGGTVFSVRPTTEFDITERDPTGKWSPIRATIKAEQLGFPQPSPVTQENVSAGTLRVHQFIPIGNGRYVARISPEATLAENFAKGGAVFVLGPGSSVTRVVEADKPITVDRAANLIFTGDGKVFSAADGSAVSVPPLDLRTLTALSGDGAYVLTVDSAADGAGPLTIAIGRRDGSARSLVQVDLPSNMRVCPGAVQFWTIAWTGR